MHACVKCHQHSCLRVRAPNVAVCVHDLEGPLVKPWLGMHASVRSWGYCFGGMFSSHCEGFISFYWLDAYNLIR